MLIIKNIAVSLNNQPIIHNLSLEIAPGSVHALMGQNGSGKSTLAAALMGDPRYIISSGSIELAGVNLLELTPDKRARAGLFLAFQQPIALPGVRVFTFLHESYNARHELKLGPQEFTELLYAAMDLVALDRTYAQREVNEGFSGGEKKKLELVQLILARPKVAILDEIDSGLDIDALKLVSRIIEHMREVSPHISFVLITHYQRLLEYAMPEMVHVMQRGKLVYSGSADVVQLIEHKGYEGING